MHITQPDVESVNQLSRYLLPLQVEGVLNDARYQFTRKANRVGWTWTMALKDIRTRLMKPKRDCLFTTQNWNGAVEFGRYIDQWLEVYNLGRFMISRSEEIITVHQDDGKGGKVAVQEKVGIYKFDGGSRIILFSSNPWAIQTYEGDVRWDECEFHERQEQMHTALITRIQFGYDYHAWSACNGVGTWVNQTLYKQASKPGSGWHCRKITIYDVIEEGLVEKINARAGTNMTREEFLADCKKRALTPAIFAERFECNPSDTGSAIVPWSVLEKCRDQYIGRHHMGDAQIKELFGSPTSSGEYRMNKMREWMAAQFGWLHGRKEKMRIGFDVAASGKGDLGSLWVDASVQGQLQQRALLTTQTEDWDFLTVALMWLMELPDARGCGDSTGLGRQISWTAEQRTQGRFRGVPFNRTTKSAMGSRLMDQLTRGECRIAAGPRENKSGILEAYDDIAYDIFALQKKAEGTMLTFEATQNPLNLASHCDMAWSKALAAEADANMEADALLPHRFNAPATGNGWESVKRSMQRRVRSILG